MASLGKINEIVDDKAYAQVDQLTDKLNSNNQALLNNINNVLQLNAALGNSKSLKDLTANVNEQAKALNNVATSQDKARLSEIQLQKAREKAFDDYEKKLAKQVSDRDKASLKEAQAIDKMIAADEKRAVIVQRNLEKERLAEVKVQQTREKNIDAYNQKKEKEYQANLKAFEAGEKAASPYVLLTNRLKQAEDAALNLGAAFGSTSPQYIEAAARVQTIRKEVDAIEQPINKFQRNVGSYGNAFVATLSKAYGFVRVLANIIPGLGISGIFLLAFEGLKALGEEFGLFTDKINKFSELLKSLNDVSRASSDEFGKQAVSLKVLYTAATDLNNSYTDRLKYSKQLQDFFPDYFKNLTQETILNGGAKNAYDELSSSILNSAKARAALAKIQDLTGKLEESEFTKQKIRNARANETAGYIATVTEANAKGQSIIKPGSEAFNAGLKSIADRADKALKGEDERQKILKFQIDFFTKYAGGNTALANALTGGQKGGNEQVNAEAKAVLDYQKEILERAINTNQAIANDTKRSYASRIVALKAYTEDQKKLIGVGEQQNNLSGTTRGPNQVLADSASVTTQLLEVEDNYNKSLKNLQSDAAKDRIDRLDSEVEKRQAIAKRVAEDENQNYKTRLKAIDVYSKASSILIKRSYDEQVIEAGQNEDKIGTINNNRAKSQNELLLETSNLRQKLQDDVNRKYEQAQNEVYKRLSAAEKERVIELQDASNQRLQIIDKETNEAKKLLLAQFANGEINTTEYNTRLFSIEQSASARRIELQIETVKKVIAAQAAGLAFGIGSNADLQKSTEDLTKLVNDSEQLKTKVVLDNAKIREDAVKNLHKLEGELTEQSLELIAKVVSARFDAQQKELDDQSNAIDKKADKDKKDVDRSLLTSEQKADAEALIDAQATSQKEAIAQQQKDIAKEQADYEKAIGLLRIAVKTGETIFALEASAAQASAQGALLLANPLTAAFAPIAFAAAGAILAQIPFVIGQGLVQAAAVALVPGFFGGTDNAPGGLAWVGELGSELIVDPQGRTTLSPNGATLSYLQPGTQVFTHEKTMQMLSKPERLSPAQSGGMSWDAFARLQERQTSRLEKSMGVRVTTQKITRGGFRTIQQQNNSRTEYKNRYLR